LVDDIPFHEGSGALTSKQREVLELLIRHKTSKEIARSLGISPYTVDQRITAARKKFGVSSRNELAESYRQVSGVSEELVYQSSHVANPAWARDDIGGATADLLPSQNHLNLMKFGDGEEKVSVYRVVPEIFEGPYGVLARLVAIGTIAIMLLITVLGGLAAFGQLSDLLG
jgi:DNA-binding CsgD family transcriptional regulator